MRFFTVAGLVNQLEEAQKGYRLDRFLTQLDKTDLMVVDELGYLSFSHFGAELLFQVFADRYERSSLLITSNLAFGDCGQVFPGERMTAALLDRLTHRCHILEMNGDPGGPELRAEVGPFTRRSPPGDTKRRPFLQRPLGRGSLSSCKRTSAGGPCQAVSALPMSSAR